MYQDVLKQKTKIHLQRHHELNRMNLCVHRPYAVFSPKKSCELILEYQHEETY